MSSIADFESMMDLDGPIKSSKQTRWERKQNNDTSSKSGDRFITNRSAMDNCENIESNFELPSDASKHAKVIAENNDTSNSRVLAFKTKAPMPTEGYQNSLKVLYSAQGAKRDIVKTTRHISSAPVRILDAPEMVDDYYLNLLSWSATNVLAVALSQTLYMWCASSGEIKELMNVADPNNESNNDYISSVSFLPQAGTHIAIGTASNTVQLWDVTAQKQVRSMNGHSSRVGALAWNNHILSSGSRDNTIINHDVRVQNHIVGTMTTHTQEVCGLAWSPDGTYLASGANDNTLCITESANMHTMNATPRHILTDHQAAVKALAWSPHERNLLASGGGTNDRCIKFWNAQSGMLLNSIDTHSQVCALQWSPLEKELLSSHGFAENQLCLWKYPTMACVKEFKGHTSRVLHMAQSPDGSMVCSGSADETLRFWNIFGSEGGKKKSESSFPAGNGMAMHIR